MDKITIERETLEQAIDALECSLNDSRPYIVKSRESAAALRAALAAQLAEPVACKGIPRKGCNYLAPTDTVCNKCGKIHHHHQMLAHFYAASPAPAADEQIRVLREALETAENALRLIDAAMPFPVAKLAIKKSADALEATK